MTRKEIKDMLREAVNIVTPLSDRILHEEMLMSDYFDSLDQVEILMNIEKKVGYLGDACDSAQTFGEVVDCIYRALNKKEPNQRSVIEWQTGEPKENGQYLVTLQVVEAPSSCICLFRLGGIWVNGDWNEVQNVKIIAWCKLADVEPYKEEEK